MLSWLQDIWNAVKDVPFLILGGIVEIINAFIVAIAALAKFVIGLLPSFPPTPDAPEGVIGWLLWIVPLAPIIAIFSLMVICWINFLAIKVVLNWVKAL